MQEATFEELVERLVARDARYHREAYIFVKDALDRTQKAVKEMKPNAGRELPEEEKHVSGQELLAGIRAHALDEFGPMTITVLEEWGVRRCRDFGEIVFNMVEIGLLKKTERDQVSDFDGGYDFEEAFRKPFLPQSEQTGRSTPGR